jgi:hypothetical protein
MALGFTIERIAYRPLRNAPRLAPLITAIGVSIVLQQLAMIIWGRNYHTFPPSCPRQHRHCRRHHHRRAMHDPRHSRRADDGALVCGRETPGLAGPCAPRRRIRKWPG